MLRQMILPVANYTTTTHPKAGLLLGLGLRVLQRESEYLSDGIEASKSSHVALRVAPE